jgi:hypothetical protein
VPSFFAAATRASIPPRSAADCALDASVVLAAAELAAVVPAALLPALVLLLSLLHPARASAVTNAALATTSHL